MPKIYGDDTNLRYKTTTKRAIDSKRDIDAELARWGITKVFWDWDLEHNKVELQFQFNEKFKDTEVNPVVRLKPPTIWKKKKRGKPDEIDWKLSIRIFHWWIRNQMLMTYAMQSEKILAFLPHMVVKDDKTVKDVLLNLEELKRLEALPGPIPEPIVENNKIIDL